MYRLVFIIDNWPFFYLWCDWVIILYLLISCQWTCISKQKTLFQEPAAFLRGYCSVVLRSARLPPLSPIIMVFCLSCIDHLMSAVGPGSPRATRRTTSMRWGSPQVVATITLSWRFARRFARYSWKWGESSLKWDSQRFFSTFLLAANFFFIILIFIFFIN